MVDYGDAIIKAHYDERGHRTHLTVERADDVIGISAQLLAEADPEALVRNDDGTILLAGDPNYRYRPVRVDPGTMVDAAGRCDAHVYARVREMP